MKKVFLNTGNPIKWAFKSKIEKLLFLNIEKSVLSRGIMAKILDCGFEVSEFEIHLSYDVHFRTNTRVNGLNSSSIDVTAAWKKLRFNR